MGSVLANVSQIKAMGNLTEVARHEKAQRESTRLSEDVKGKILEFLWKLKKQGYSEATIRTYGEALNTIVHKDANIFDPESVKEKLAKEKFSEASKHIIIAAYSKFLEMQGGTWVPPICQVSRRLPFIPLEREIDDLIAGCGKKTATFLLVLKETAMRAGEALRLKWTSIDFKRRIIILNEPEKHGNPRVFKISPKLTGMLEALPKKSDRVFNCTYISVKSGYVQARKRLARKLGNPRLQRITFHTLRHWKATMEYHKTKDPLYVKEMLGHKSMNTTLLYIQLEKTLFKESSDEFTVKVAKDPERIKALLEVGFEYVCKKDDLMFFRKRK
jgi:integrase